MTQRQRQGEQSAAGSASKVNGIGRIMGRSHTFTLAHSCGPGRAGHVIVYLEVMERPRVALTAEDTGVEDRVGAALRLWAMCALTR
jgi:hypothetical protein